jgi:hypothetical protein
MGRYYGYYSNAKRGRRKNKNQDEWMPWILEANESSKEYRKNWARLIQKIYEVDPLRCPKCSGKMKVISVIEDEDVIKKILKHLGLWEVKARLPAKTNANILYVAFARFGREIYKRRQKSIEAELKMILLFLEIPYIV